MNTNTEFIIDTYMMVYKSKFLNFVQLISDNNWYLLVDNNIIANNSDINELINWYIKSTENE